MYQATYMHVAVRAHVLATCMVSAGRMHLDHPTLKMRKEVWQVKGVHVHQIHF